jgi:hypothetical protein
MDLCIFDCASLILSSKYGRVCAFVRDQDEEFSRSGTSFRHILFTQDSTIRSVKSSVMNVLIQVKNRCRRRQHHDD